MKTSALIFSFFALICFVTHLAAIPAIPEPGLTLYGKVSVAGRSGSNLPISNIAWTFADQTSGGNTVSLALNQGITTTVQGGETWYVARIPFASRNVPGLSLDPVPAGHLEFGASARQIVRTLVTVNGRNGALLAPAEGTIAFPSSAPVERSRTERVDITISPPDYPTWINGFLGSSNSVNRLAQSDPDTDGAPNLTEYALGGNPADAGSRAASPEFTVTALGGGSSALVYQYVRRLDAIGFTTQVVEHTGDLASAWVPAVPGQAGVTQTVVPIDDYSEQVTVSIPYTGLRHFARLKLTLLTSVLDYSAWITGFLGSSTGPNSSALSDPDKDGYANLMEFAMGGNPTVALAELAPQLVITNPPGGGSALSFSYKRSVGAIGYTDQWVEHADDLAGPWTTAVPGQGGVAQQIVQVDDNTERVTVTIPYSGPRHFARLKISTK